MIVSVLVSLTFLPREFFGPEAAAADLPRAAAPAGFVCGATFRPVRVGGRESVVVLAGNAGAGFIGEAGKVRELADLGESICFGSILTREVVRSGKLGAAFWRFFGLSILFSLSKQASSLQVVRIYSMRLK